MAHPRPQCSHGFMFLLGIAFLSGMTALTVVYALRYNGISTCPQPVQASSLTRRV